MEYLESKILKILSIIDNYAQIYLFGSILNTPYKARDIDILIYLKNPVLVPKIKKTLRKFGNVNIGEYERRPGNSLDFLIITSKPDNIFLNFNLLPIDFKIYSLGEDEYLL